MKHMDKLLQGIEEERKNEQLYFENISKNKTQQEKVKAGILWPSINIVKKYYTIGEHIELHIERTKNVGTNHRFKSGIAVSLTIEMSETKRFRCTVNYVSKFKMRILIMDSNLSLDDIPNFGNAYVELLYDERPYQVMRSAIETIQKTKDVRLRHLAKSIGDLQDPQANEIDLSRTCHEFTNLNASQNMAIQTALKSPYLSIIHGPPGTGKTTTIVSLVKALLQYEKQILVCAPSNNAVDLLAERLDKKGIKVLRIGNVSRINDEVTKLCLDEKARSHKDWINIKKVKIESERMFQQAGKFKRKFGHEERQERKFLYQEAKALRDWGKELESRLTSELIHESEVICSTLIGISNREMTDKLFSTLIIDEASQAFEPASWNAMIKAEKTILVGDHMQLAPTVKSTQAQKLGLDNTLLDRMLPIIKHRSLLNIQYRMHEAILSFSNQQFYQSLLQSGDKNAKHTLPNDLEPLTFIDTSGCGFEEQMHHKNISFYNEGEFGIIREHIFKYKASLLGASIGIISPYAEQVRYIEQQIKEDKDIFEDLHIIVNTIDGFQGQEMDAIYISLVRSNNAGQVGFLKDQRRLNVAMTRARKKLIIIGDMATLGSSPLFNQLAEHIEKQGTYQTAWEYFEY